MRGSSRKLLGSGIAADLEAEIIDGRLAAGLRLEENEIARRFEVSRTPVREALQLLAARSLVERVPYRGVIVSEISQAEIEKLFEAMGELEALCGSAAAQRMSIGERAGLLELHRDMEALAAAGKRADYAEVNAAFHNRLFEGAHNRYLAEAAEALRLKLAPFRRAQLADITRMQRSSAEHAEIVAAICERDADAAARALRRHLVSAAAQILARWAPGRARAGSRSREKEGNAQAGDYGAPDAAHDPHARAMADPGGD